MNAEDAFEAFNRLAQYSLGELEKKTFIGIWQGQTYENIAEQNYSSPQHIKQYVARKLFSKVTEIWEIDVDKVGKKNFKTIVEPLLKKHLESPESSEPSPKIGNGGVSNSFYVEPEKLQDCYNEIVKPGALIRIKGPHKTGKTLLLNKIIDRANEKGYDLAIVNFAETDAEVLSDYQKLLRWFCLCLGDELELEPKVEEHFQGDFGNNTSCINYLESYLLAGRSQPLVLVLEGVDAVFEVASFNNDFCRMLRAWHDTAKRPSRRAKIWKPVSLIIVHSTEVYGDLDINSSPLAGVGLTVALSGFNLEQVKQLAASYELGLNDGEIRQVMDAFGGHPYLVKNALVFLKQGELNLTELLEIAPTEASPFGNHLRELLGKLERQADLAAAYLEVVKENRPIQLATNFTFKLESLGLVKVEKDFCLPYCELYRQYFSSRLSS